MQNSVFSLRYLKIIVVEREKESEHGLNIEPVAQRIPQWSFRERRADSLLGNIRQPDHRAKQRAFACWGRIQLQDNPIWKNH